MKSLFRIFLVLLFVVDVYASKLIKIETKDFGKQIAFVFYHQDKNNLQIAAIGKNVIVKGDDELRFTQINPVIFNKFASGLQLTNGNKSFSFKFKHKYNDFHKINGEKFTAIEFNVSENIEIKEPDNKSEISISKRGANVLIHFPLNSHIGSAAFIKDDYFWVVLDKNKKFIVPNNKIFTSISQLHDSQKTVFKFKLNGQKGAKFKQDAKGLTIELTNIPETASGSEIKVMPFEGDDKTLVEVSNIKIHKLHDALTNQYIYVFTMQHRARISKTLEHKNYKILPTSQGVAIVSEDDALQTDQHDQGILIGNKGKIVRPDLVFEDVSDPNSLLPVCAVNDKEFIGSKLALEKSLNANLPPNEAYSNLLKLANFYFCHEMYQESAGMLNIASIECPDLFRKDLKAYLLTAVNLSLTNQYSKAKEIYGHIFSKLPDENRFPALILWNNYNEFKLGKSQMHLLNNMQLINNYQDNLYFKVALSGIESYLNDDVLTDADEAFNLVRKTQNKSINNELLFLRARLFALRDDHTTAKNIYQTLLQNAEAKNDNFNLLRATIGLTKLRYLDQEVTATQAIDTLNALRFAWRGDNLEQDLLLNLAFYYKEIDDKINVLRTYKYIESCFQGQFIDVNIASEAAALAREIFLAENNRGDLENVSLFLEFEDYIPSDKDGIKVITQTAQKMLNLTLYDQAAELLNKHIATVDSMDKLYMSDMLAESYLYNQKPQEAIKILEDTDSVNFSFSEYIKRARLKALSYETMGQLDKAISYISMDDGHESYVIKKRLYFKAGKWQKFIDLVEAASLELVQGKIDDNPEARKDIMMLAVSYTSLDQKDKLQALIGYLKLSPNLQKSLQKLASLNQENGDINLQDLQKFIDDYKKVF